MAVSRTVMREAAALLALGAVACGHAMAEPAASARINVRTEDGMRRTEWAVPGVWVEASERLRLHCPYRRGAELRFERKGPRMFVRIDGGPARLAGVLADTPEGTAALRQAIAESVSPLTIWCSAKTLPAVPKLPGGRDYALEVNLEDGGSIAPVAKQANLRALALSECGRAADLSPLSGLAGLTSLRLANPRYLILMRRDELADLTPLARLSNLRVLDMVECSKLADLSPVAKLASLRALRIRKCGQVRDLAPLAELAGLQSLTVDMCEQVADLKPLARLKTLTHLRVFGCTRVTDLTPLAGLVQLHALDLGACGSVADLAPLAKLTRLSRLDLRACYRIADISPLAALTELAELSLAGCQDVADLKPLAGLTRLTKLNVAGCLKVTDLAPLRAMARRGGQIYVSARLRPKLEELRK